MLENLMNGIEQVSQRADLLLTTLEQVENVFAKEIDLNMLKSLSVDVDTQSNSLKEAINIHRMYLTPLIPFGDSSKIFNSINSISAALSTISTYYSKMNQEDKHDNINILSNEIVVYKKVHKELRLKIATIMQKLNQGQDIFLKSKGI
jgi:hypothetical protein